MVSDAVALRGRAYVDHLFRVSAALPAFIDLGTSFSVPTKP